MCYDVYSQMLQIAINNAENDAIKIGLEIALELLEESGAITLTDWENMTEEERLKVVKY